MEKSIHTSDYKLFLRLLREAREAAGITQVELAKTLGQTQSFVSKVELGDSRIDLVQLRTILLAIGVRLGDFVEQFERELARTR
jgi:transcriptional regulator with XRE-family HTH domain